MYKAIDTGDDEMQTVLVGRRITEDQLKTYIGGNKPIQYVESFDEQMKRMENHSKRFTKLKKIVKDKVQYSSSSEGEDTDNPDPYEEKWKSWKFNDGLSKSVLSRESEKGTSGYYDTGYRGKRIDLIDLVDNIDSVSEIVDHLPITKNDFFNCLREVTLQKVKGIKQAKDIFDKRIRKMMRAQDYEL